MGLDQKLDKLRLNITDISIIKVNEDAHLLYVIFCKSLNDAQQLMDIIESEPFDFKALVSEKGSYIFRLKFHNAKESILIPTTYNFGNYPALNWMFEYKNSPCFITTGIYQSDGRFVYNPDFRPVEKPF